MHQVTQPFIATQSKVNGERPHCLHTSMTLQLGPLRSFSTAICSTFLLGKWPSPKDKGYCNNKKGERLDFFFSTTEKNDLWAFFPLSRATLLLLWLRKKLSDQKHVALFVFCHLTPFSSYCHYKEIYEPPQHLLPNNVT